MTSLNSVPDEPFDPFAEESVYYSEAEFTHGEVDAKRELTSMQLRKPSSGNEWFMLHSGSKYTWPASTFTRVAESGDETYLVPKQVRHFFDETVLMPVRLRLAVNSVGTAFIWPQKVNTSSDSRMANHYRALQRISEEAEKTWVKLSKYDFSSRVYHYDTAPGDFGDPRWPDKPMRDLVELAFNGLVIDRTDHPVILEHGRRA
jgi:hypothetical protein